MNSVHTEITDENGETLFYDGDCSFCTHWADRLSPILRRRGVVVRPLPVASEEMRLRTADGEVLGGADAVVYLARRIWWAWPLRLPAYLPGGMTVLRRGYRWVARNRSCKVGRASCLTSAAAKGHARRVSYFGGLPVLIALGSRPFLPPWGFMWVMTVALFGGFKWVMWRRGLSWPRPAADGAPGGRALPRIVLGTVLFWGVARLLPPLAAGWVGMIGLVLMLHFGVMALAWPIMRAPLRARSVAEFWGERWNCAFPQMARPLIFEPVSKRYGTGWATMVVFLASGLLHELVISLPAGGGYGLPTGYFALQGAAVLVERKWRTDRRWFVWLMVAGPVFWLFHPLFVERVMISFMEAMGAL